MGSSRPSQPPPPCLVVRKACFSSTASYQEHESKQTSKQQITNLCSLVLELFYLGDLENL